MIDNNPATDNTDPSDRQAADDFYEEMAGLNAASHNLNLSPDASAAKEDAYRLHHIAAGIDYLMNLSNNSAQQEPDREPAPAAA